MSLQHDIHRPTVVTITQIRSDGFMHRMRRWLLCWALIGIGLWGVLWQPVHAASTLLLTPTATGTPAALSLSAQLQVADADRRQMGQIFVLAVLPNNSQFALSNLGWTAVGNAAPSPYLQGELGTHTLDVLSGLDVSALAGTVLYGGYGTSFSEMLKRQLFGVIYSATIMVDPVNFKVMDGISSQATTDGIEQIEAFAKRLGGLPHVRWASLSGTAQAWRNAGRVPSRVTNTQ